MNEFAHRHVILRVYVALARGEQFESVPYTYTAMQRDRRAVLTGDVEGPSKATFCYYLDDTAQRIFCAKWQIDPREFFALMIFARPSFVQNLFYSSEMRRIFGIDALREHPEFTSYGQFKLDDRPGYYVPVVDQFGLISSFAYYNTKGDRIV